MTKLSAKTLKKSFLNWFSLTACSQQAESMLSMAFGQSMAPVIDELYDTKEEVQSTPAQHHAVQYRSSGGIICNGIVCGMEEANANGESTPGLIESVKVALIGPLPPSAIPVGRYDYRFS